MSSFTLKLAKEAKQIHDKKVYEQDMKTYDVILYNLNKAIEDGFGSYCTQNPSEYSIIVNDFNGIKSTLLNFGYNIELQTGNMTGSSYYRIRWT